MIVQNVNLLMFAESPADLAPERFIEVFHRWIREQVLDELLIDVADYRHVPAGPDVLLVGHDANYSLERSGRRYGLCYQRKTPFEGSNEDRFLQAFQAVTRAARLLEEEPWGHEPLRFSSREFKLIINDRALAPNRPQSYASLKPELQSFLHERLGYTDVCLEGETDSRLRFGVTVDVAA